MASVGSSSALYRQPPSRRAAVSATRYQAPPAGVFCAADACSNHDPCSFREPGTRQGAAGESAGTAEAAGTACKINLATTILIETLQSQGSKTRAVTERQRRQSHWSAGFFHRRQRAAFF